MRRRVALLLASGLAMVVGCLFDGEQTKGLPCTGDEHCGIGQECIAGVCGENAGVDACIDGLPVCTNEDVIQTCAQGEPLNTPCETVCRNNGVGKSLTCAFSPGAGNDVCFCDQGSGLCDPNGTVECIGNDMHTCSDGFWNHADCDFVCANAGQGSGAGCSAGSCACTDGPCVEGSSYCASSDAVAICENGVFVQYGCSQDGCVDSVNIGCGYLASAGDETCLCGL